jgi:hypothetical protein
MYLQLREGKQNWFICPYCVEDKVPGWLYWQPHLRYNLLYSMGVYNEGKLAEPVKIDRLGNLERHIKRIHFK